MVYSLKKFLNYTNFKHYNLSEVIENLNLIGFEIDLFNQNRPKNDILYILKIPANRNELLIQHIFIKEFLKTLELPDDSLWKTWKKFYFKNIFKNSQNLIESIKINVSSNVNIFIEISLEKKNFSPKWIQKELLEKNKNYKNDIDDLNNFTKLELGYMFKNSIFFYKNKFFITIYLKKLIFKISKNEEKILKHTYKRLFTLLEIIYKINLFSLITLKNKKFFYEKEKKIIKVKKFDFKKILNIDKINYSVFKKANLQISCINQTSIYFSISNLRKDLIRPIDILEEYAKFINYKNFFEIKPQVKNFKKLSTRQLVLFIKNFFISNGFFEVYTNPLTITEFKNFTKVKLINPLTQDLSCLKISNLENLIKIFEENNRLELETKKYFEINRNFKINNSKDGFQENEKLYYISSKIKNIENFYQEWLEAKVLFDNFFNLLGISKYINYKLLKNPSVYYHLKNCITINYKGYIIGCFGKLNPLYQYKNKHIFRTSLYCGEINISILLRKLTNIKIKSFKAVNIISIIQKDFSFVSSKNLDFLELQSEIKKFSNKIYNSYIFDIFIIHSRKVISIGIRIKFLNTTFTDNETEKFVKFLEIKFGLCLNNNKII